LGHNGDASGDLAKRGIAYIRAASAGNQPTASTHCMRIRTSTLRSRLIRLKLFFNLIVVV